MKFKAGKNPWTPSGDPLIFFSNLNDMFRQIQLYFTYSRDHSLFNNRPAKSTRTSLSLDISVVDVRQAGLAKIRRYCLIIQQIVIEFSCCLSSVAVRLVSRHLNMTWQLKVTRQFWKRGKTKRCKQRVT